MAPSFQPVVTTTSPVLTRRAFDTSSSTSTLRLPADGLTIPAAFSAGTLADTCRARIVDQHDLALVRADLARCVRRASRARSTTASFLRTPSAEPAAIVIRELYRARRPAEDVGGDLAIAREAEVGRLLREVELRAQVAGVRRAAASAAAFRCAQDLVLGLGLVALAAGAVDVVHPAVDVAEGPCDALRGRLERRRDADRLTLGTVQRTGVSFTEVRRSAGQARQVRGCPVPAGGGGCGRAWPSERRARRA